MTVQDGLPLRIGSLFSGIGGLELGLERSGLGHTVWQVEQDPFCQSILAKHWPNAERLSDVKEVGAQNLAPVDLICGGFPCQDVSGAGARKGLAGHRSGLWFEFARIVGELRPGWVVVENVASGAKLWVDTVCASLEQLGYETLPVPLSASDVGAPHLRRRIFIVARSDGIDGRARGKGRTGPCDQSRGSETPKSPASDPDSEHLREQSGRGEGSQGESAVQPTVDGTTGAATHTDHKSQYVEPINGEMASQQADPWREWRECGRFPISPVCRMDDGTSRRMDRLRALGNAVVPQCAEVIGWMIREMWRFP